MIDELLEMYRAGAITGYQVMIDCLQRLDPNHPDLVLSRLPGDILDEMLAYARRYDASRMRSIAGPAPTEDQVRAAEQWIEEQRQQAVKRNLASLSE